MSIAFPDVETTMGTTFSLRDLGLQAGQARTRDLDVEIVPYRQAGADFGVAGGTVAARLDVTAMDSGYAFRLRLRADLAGPCARCLEDATAHVRVDSHEVHDPHAQDPDLVCDFVVGDEIDVTAWAQDAVGLLFPPRVLCREDCHGLCPGCGINRNEATCDCDLTVQDSRWDALRGLSFDSGEDDGQ